MKLTELAKRLDLALLAGGEGLNREITGGYVSDLLSDVMGYAREGNIWVTIQIHANIIPVASLKDLAGIIIANGNIPDRATLDKANKEGIAVMGSNLTAFDLCGRIFDLLKQ